MRARRRTGAARAQARSLVACHVAPASTRSSTSRRWPGPHGATSHNLPDNTEGSRSYRRCRCCVGVRQAASDTGRRPASLHWHARQSTVGLGSEPLAEGRGKSCGRPRSSAEGHLRRPVRNSSTAWRPAVVARRNNKAVDRNSFCIAWARPSIKPWVCPALRRPPDLRWAATSRPYAEGHCMKGVHAPHLSIEHTARPSGPPRCRGSKLLELV